MQSNYASVCIYHIISLEVPRDKIGSTIFTCLKFHPPTRLFHAVRYPLDHIVNSSIYSPTAVQSVTPITSLFHLIYSGPKACTECSMRIPVTASFTSHHTISFVCRMIVSYKVRWVFLALLCSVYAHLLLPTPFITP
jgi:hypothetical protein